MAVTDFGCWYEGGFSRQRDFQSERNLPDLASSGLTACAGIKPDSMLLNKLTPGGLFFFLRVLTKCINMNGRSPTGGFSRCRCRVLLFMSAGRLRFSMDCRPTRMNL